MIKKEQISRVDKQAVSRYSQRLKKFGPDVKALGWDTEENQMSRFASAVSWLDLKNKTILDLGCGFGDFLKFLQAKQIPFGGYQGVDINPDLLRVARQRYPNMIFSKRNILLEPFRMPVADIVFSFGLLNFNLKGRPDNYLYAREFIKRAFQACREALAVDMLSAYLDQSYPKEDFVFYYQPEKMFEFAQGLTNKVILKHDARPMPQKEFTLYLKK